MGVWGGIPALLSPFTLTLTLSHRGRGKMHRSIPAVPGMPRSRRFAKGAGLTSLLSLFAFTLALTYQGRGDTPPRGPSGYPPGRV